MTKETAVRPSCRPLRLGVFCPEVSGHLNPMLSLAKELQRRGHTVTFLAKLDAEERVRAVGVDFRAIATDVFPRGSWNEAMRRLGLLSGRAALKYTVEFYRQTAAVILKEIPQHVRALAPDGLLVDQTVTPGATIAELLDLPFVSVCCALPVNEDPGLPPIVTPWKYREGFFGRWRNRLGHAVFRLVSRSIKTEINTFRTSQGLTPQKDVAETFSRLAQIVQIPAAFDFPRLQHPAAFHYVGPLHTSAGRPPVPFPYERLSGDKPVIYASMGTLQNRLQRVFAIIAEACAPLDAQLVLSQGGGDCGEAASFPGDPIVVPYAPQLELLQRAAVTITHAGLNTAMESLAQGVPMVAIPVTNDQPGVASRIAWTGCGLTVPLSKLSVPRLRDAVQRLLQEESFRRSAQSLQQAIRQAGGVHRAADIVETAIATKQPVTS